MTGLLAQGAGTLAQSPIGFDVEGLTKNFWQLTIDGLSYGSVYALIAVGYTLVYGVLRLINFAHSEVFMVGMFGQYVALQLLGFAPSGNTYNQGLFMTILFLAVALLLGMVVSGGVAVGLERVAYRPLRKRGASSLVFLITAIGAYYRSSCTSCFPSCARVWEAPPPSSRSSWWTRKSSSACPVPR